MRGGNASAAGEYVRLPKRILVASHVIPPHASGHAVVLYRLFGSIHPDDYRVITFDDLPAEAVVAADMKALPAKTFRYPSGWHLGMPSDYPLRNARVLRLLIEEVLRTAMRMATVCRHERCRAIVATSGTLPRLPAAAVAARLAGVPLYILMWDFWRFQETWSFLRRIVELLEPSVVRSARAVAAPNELLVDALARVDRIAPVLIRNPIADEALIPGPGGTQHRRGDARRIVYTGQVYAAMHDAVVNLLRALEEPGLEDIRLHYYGPQSETDLRNIGVEGKITCHPFLDPSEIYAVQRAADILFLPLAFTGQLADIIYTSSTTKLADYLASGRPILVHAPPGAFPAWYVRRHECGLVVDSPSPKALARAIRHLLSDSALQQRLGERAIRRAHEDFSIGEAQSRLIAMLEER